jgi:hypothetical protein
MKIFKDVPDEINIFKVITFFKEEEKIELRKMLADFKEEQVWKFIQQTQFICQRVLLYRENFTELEYKSPA